MARSTPVSKSPQVPVKGKKSTNKQAPAVKKPSPPPREKHTRNPKSKTPNYATGLQRTPENTDNANKADLGNNQNDSTEGAKDNLVSVTAVDPKAPKPGKKINLKNTIVSRSRMIVNYWR